MGAEDRDRAMRDYYDRRAAHLDRDYRRGGEPPSWVLTMVADLRGALRGRRVLEIACGTGHWTMFAAAVAGYVLGIDTSPAMLALARAQGLPPARGTFLAADAYDLGAVPGEFDAALAMQWFSHVPRARHDDFLDGLHRRVGAGAVVFLGDNRPHAAMREQPYTRPGEADTFELRTLPGSPTYEIVKNYFVEEELRAIFAPRATDLRLTMGERWWWLRYIVCDLPPPLSC